MKVLHIITRMNTGGPAVFLDHLTNAMGELGVKSTIAYGFCESNETDYTESHKLGADLFNIGSLHRSLNPLHDLKSFIKIRKIIKQVKPDLVNTHTSKAGVLGRLAAKSVNTKLPVVHTFHGHLIYGYFAKYKTIIFTLIERFLARFTDVAVCITKETQDSLRGLGIGKNLKWAVIRLGIPVDQNSILERKSGSKTRLLWVGRFTYVKDPLYAVAVINHLEKISPNRFELVMIGGGELLEQAKAASQDLPIKFTGWLDQPFQSAGNFDLLLLTSVNEGMGLVMLEAANLSRATIARDVGGVGEFLKHGVNGFLVDGTATDMAQSISALSDPDIVEMGISGRKILTTEFSDKRLGKEYLELYKSLI
jgi:glycosyltransferase involved in cell wall biosynthesis